MEQVVKALQSVVSLPLQLDSSHAEALERGLRVYNGKPIVNSVCLLYTSPEKIEDFTPFLAEVHKTAGVYGTVVPGWDQWYFETLYLNEGVQIITDDNTCDLGSDTALEMCIRDRINHCSFLLLSFR